MGYIPESVAHINDRKAKSYVNVGATDGVEALRETALRVNDCTTSTNQLAVAGETISLTAGAAGTTGVVGVDKAPIYDSTGTRIGYFNSSTDKSSSFAWVTGTVLPNASQVRYKHELNDTDQLSEMTNGQWALDYDTGKIRYKKATTGTSDTCNYTSRQMNIEITGASSTVTENVNLAKVAGTATSVNSGTLDAGTQRVAIATDDVNLALVSSAIKAEDAAHTTGDKGIMSLSVRSDTPASTAGTTGDYAALITDANGALYTMDRAINSPLVATHISPVDGTVAFTTNVTITCSSFPFTVDDANCSVSYIFYKPSAGTWTLLVNGKNGVSMTASSNVITVSGAGTPFASGDTYRIGIREQDKAFTKATNSKRSQEIYPLDQKYVEEELIDTTNVAAATNYYPSSDGLTMGGYNSFDVGFVISGGVTMTIEATLDDAASPDWLDITKAGYELVTNAVGGASFIDTSGILSFDGLRARKVRIKSVTSDATNAVQYHIKRTYR